MTAEIARRRTVAELVRVYERARLDVVDSYRCLDAAENALNDAFSLGEHRSIYLRDSSRGYYPSFSDPSGVLKQLERSVWSCLVDRLELRRMMSIERAKELDKQLEEGTLPEVTVESVMIFAKGFADNLDLMLREAVVEVFQWLRPRRGSYKTNSQFEIGKKVILEYSVEGGFSGKYRINSYREQNFRALENVFTALDGAGSVTKTYKSKIADAVERCDRENNVGSTDYFRFKCFRNRNLHLEFLRPDLVEKLNKIAGGMNLREKTS